MQPKANLGLKLGRDHETVTNLKSLLALPLDTAELADYLSTDSLLVVNGASKVRSGGQEQALQPLVMSTLHTQETILSNSTMKAMSEQPIELVNLFSWLSLESFLLALVIAALALYKKGSGKNVIDDAHRGLCHLVEKGTAGSDDKAKIILKSASNEENTPHNRNPEIDKVDDGLTLPTCVMAQEERIRNFKAQNVLLQKSLEEQRTTIRKLRDEMHCRDEYLAKLEVSHNQTLKDLSVKVMLLEQQREEQTRAREADVADRDTLARKLHALAETVRNRAEVWDAFESTQELARKDLVGQIQSLENREATNKLQQDEQLANCMIETEQARDQVKHLSQRLESVQKELACRTVQMTKLGQYLKAKDEQGAVQRSNLESQYETLGSKVQGLTDEVQAQRAQTTRLAKLVEEHVNESASRFDEIETTMGTQHNLQMEQSQCFDKAYRAALDDEIQRLRTDVQQQLWNAFAESQGRLLLCETGIQSLGNSCRSEAEKSAIVVSRLEVLSAGMATRKDLEVSLLRQEKHLLSCMEDIERNGQSRNEKQLDGLINKLEAQSSELMTKLRSVQDGQTSLLKQFRKAIEDKVTATVVAIDSIRQEMQSWQLHRLVRVDQLEEHRSALAVQVEEVSSELQLRMDIDLMTHRADYLTQLSALQKDMKILDEQQKQLSIAVVNSTDNTQSHVKAMTDSVTRCSEDVERLRQAQYALHAELDGLRSKTLGHEVAIMKSNEDNGALVAKVEYLAVECAKATTLLAASEQVVVGIKQALSSQIESMASKVQRFEDQTRGERESTQQQEFDKKVKDLSMQIQEQHEVLRKDLQQSQRGTSELSGLVDSIKCKFEADLHRQEGRVDHVSNRVDKMEEVLETLASGNRDYVSNRVDKMEEVLETLASGNKDHVSNRVDKMEEILETLASGNKDMSDEAEPRVSSCAPRLKNSLDDVVSGAGSDMAEASQPCQSHSTLSASQHDARERVDTSKAFYLSLSEAEAQYLSLCTKLVAFNGELQRREESVISLEKSMREKANTFSSRAKVLNNEIELQRHQLKRWNETTQKNKTRLVEAQERFRNFEAEARNCLGEVFVLDERVQDIDSILAQADAFGTIRARLGRQRRQQQKHSDEWHEKLDKVEQSLNENKIEISKLEAKQLLFDDELGRRRARLNTLRSSLSNVLELVAVEREELAAKLTSHRRDRAAWRQHVSALMTHIQLSESACLTNECISGLPVVQLARELRNSAAQGAESIVGHRKTDDTCSDMLLDGHGESGELNWLSRDCNLLQVRPTTCLDSTGDSCEADFGKQTQDNQMGILSKRKMGVEHQLEDSSRQWLALSERIDKISYQPEFSDRLALQVETLTSDVTSSQESLNRLKEEQISLSSDLYAQIGSLKSKLVALEDRQQMSNNSSPSQPSEMVRLIDLTAKAEALAAQFSEHGDMVAQVGTLAESIKKCEDRLTGYEKLQDDTKTDVSAMIDFFKTDLQSLKQVLEESLVRKDAEFSGLLYKVERLMQVSEVQREKVEFLDARFQGDSASQEGLAHARIQASHLIQQMTEKYIELAAKVDLLSNEICANSASQESVQRSAKDREALYLSQLNAVRVDFETQQTRHQHEIQTSIYQAMEYLVHHVAEREARFARFPAWKSSEESLAFRQRRLGTAGEIGRDDRDIRNSTHESDRTEPLVGYRSFGLGYSMVSGIIRDNMFVPVMMAPTLGMGVVNNDQGP